MTRRLLKRVLQPRRTRLKSKTLLALAVVLAGLLMVLGVQFGVSSLRSPPLAARQDGSAAEREEPPSLTRRSLQTLDKGPDSVDIRRPVDQDKVEGSYRVYQGYFNSTGDQTYERRRPTHQEVNLLKRAAQEAHQFVWNVSEESRDPQEVRHVVFIKVHKAASTTLFNVFLRFSYSRQLNVMFPKYSSNILSEFNNRLKRLLPHPPSPPFVFDVLVNHVVFDYGQIGPFFPRDTRYVAVLRDPWQRVQSAYFFFTTVFHHRYLKNTLSFGHFIRHRSEFEVVRPFRSMTNNRMSIELGLPPHQVTNRSHIAPFLRHVDRMLDLVLVMERLEESLVLMKREFRWTFKDIVYVNLNSLQYNSKTNASTDPRLMQRFRQFEQFDVALYDHYVNVLNDRVAMQTSDFHEEVEAFVHINNDLRRFCVENSSDLAFHVPASRWSAGFRVDRAECGILTAGEMSVNSWAQLRQLARLAPLMFE